VSGRVMDLMNVNFFLKSSLELTRQMNAVQINSQKIFFLRYEPFKEIKKDYVYSENAPIKIR
jgi:hypothetical protein